MTGGENGVENFQTVLAQKCCEFAGGGIERRFVAEVLGNGPACSVKSGHMVVFFSATQR